MTESETFWARGDSSSANNNSLNVEGLNKVASVEIQFSSDDPNSSTFGDLTLDGAGTGIVDSNTWISVDGGNTWTTFTIEFHGYLADDPQLYVNGIDLVGERVAIITVTGGDRLFFFPDNQNIDQLTIDSMLSKEFSLDAAGEITTPLPVCFTKGTKIRCEQGQVAVEELKVGDMVVTINGIAQAIKWIGKRSLTYSELCRNPNFAPVRIRAGALGNNLPLTDLVVSQQHRMLLDNWQVELMFGSKNALAAAKHLVNDHSIMLETPEDGVEYYHILFDKHEIIYANDALTESFHPGQWALDGLGHEARREIFELFPELENSADNYGPTAQVVLKSFEVESLLSVN